MPSSQELNHQTSAKFDHAFASKAKLEIDRALQPELNFYRKIISAVSKEDAVNYLCQLVGRGTITLEDIDLILGLTAPSEK